jgi:hypothetical protein
MKTISRYFAKHAQSSALLLSLAIHAGLLIGALSFVAFRVLVPPDIRFRPVPFDHLAPVIKRPPLKPVQLDQRVRPRPPSARIEPGDIRIKPTEILIPDTLAVCMPSLGLNKGETGDGIPINFETEIDFYDTLSQKGEKVVFLVHAGPATTSGPEREQTPRSRMTFYTIRTRLNEMVDKLPAYTLFNAAFYWQGHTTPMSPVMLPATGEHKQMMREWGSTLNPLDSTQTYGSGFDGEFTKQLARLEWPEKLTDHLPDFGPKWYYDYRCPPDIEAFYKGPGASFENWSRALCFAMEQKPDTIFILCTGYVISRDDPGMMAASYRKMARKIYGRDTKRYPTVNVVVLNKVGRDVQNALNNCSRFHPITSAFRGKSGIIKDIRDVMTREELGKLNVLD